MNENEQYFNFLEDLRKSGITNMFNAGVYLKEQFDISKDETVEILSLWMKNYSKLSEKYGWR